MRALGERLGIGGVEADLDLIAQEGLSDVITDDLLVIPRMVSLGAVPSEPLGTVQMREALKDRIRSSNALTDPQKHMALRLIGGTDDTRNLTLEGRLEAVGEVEYQGKTVGIDSVRRRPRGRRAEILLLLTDDLVRGELEARRRAGLEPMPEMIEGVPDWSRQLLHLPNADLFGSTSEQQPGPDRAAYIDKLRNHRMIE